MDSKKRNIGDNIKSPSSLGGDGEFKIDAGKDTVYYKGDEIDPDDNEDLLRRFLEEKKNEREELKNNFLDEDEKSDEIKNIPKKIGKLSTEINLIEEMLNK